MKTFFSSILVLILFCSANISASDKAKEIEKLVKSYYDNEKFMGTVLVAENGKVLYRKGIGYANLEWKIPNSPEGVFKIASITKTFTAVITMQLIQEEKLKLDNKISDFLPYYRKDIGERITIHHLLTHSSGIPNYLSLPGFVPEKIREPMPGLEEFIKKFCSNDLEFEPGTKFRYNNSGYTILGAIIEKITGMSFEEALIKRILEPVGMKNTGFDKTELLLKNRVNGYKRMLDGSFQPAAYWDISWAYTAGQMYSTVDDLLKYHEALSGEKLLKEEFKKMMFVKYFPAFGGYYGYGFMLRDLDFKNGQTPLLIDAHEGGISGFNLFFARIPEKNQVVILLNNTGDSPLKEISYNILSLLNGISYTKPKKSIAMETYKKLKLSGVEAALKHYDEIKSGAKDKFDLSEAEFNKLGYELLKVGRVDDAIKIFQKNAEEFPESGNVYDSLAEGYMIKGDKENAIKYYQKSLQLDPKNQNAGEKLFTLQK